MLIVQSEKLGMLLATNTDTENGELAETNFTRENFGNFQTCMHTIIVEYT